MAGCVCIYRCEFVCLVDRYYFIVESICNYIDGYTYFVIPIPMYLPCNIKQVVYIDKCMSMIT